MRLVKVKQRSPVCTKFYTRNFKGAIIQTRDARKGVEEYVRVDGNADVESLEGEIYMREKPGLWGLEIPVEVT